MGRLVMKVRLRDRSGICLYRYIVEDVDRHGNVRIYFRRKGQPKIRLRERPGTEAFDAEYQRAFRREVRPPLSNQHTPAMPGTMRWLCEQYYASPKFQSLAESTRKVRRGILEEICQRAGNFRYAMMETPHVAKLRERRREMVDRSVRAIDSLVQNAKLALEAGDTVGLGRLMDLNQMLLSGLMLSTEEIETMCRLAREAGALGVKLTGSGGGGCVVALAPDDPAPILERWEKAGFRSFSTRVEGDAPRPTVGSP